MQSHILLCIIACIVAVSHAQLYRHQGKSYANGMEVLQSQPKVGASETINQIVDHFNSGNNATFTQRYFVNETQWDKSDSKAPILLCVGGEGPPLDKSVLSSSVHCNDLVNYSIQKKSLTFALEHRFYGSSMPADDYSTKNLNAFLNTEQAAEDIAEFITQMKAKYDIPDSTPWVTFGGSYPGMLAAISHQTHPELIYATVCSSAPLEASVAMPGYNEIIGQAYKTELVGGSQQCFDIIQNSHNKIGELLKNAEGRRQLETDFNVCGGQGALDNELNQAMFASSGVVYLPGQGNDPACTSSLCNIEKVCSYMIDSQNEGKSDYDTMVSLNNKMSSACKLVQHSAEVSAFMIPSSPSRVWEYQTCSEWGFYMTCESNDCPFVQGLPALEAALDICKHAFNIDSDMVTSNIA